MSSAKPSGPTRRTFLQGVGVALGSVALGCEMGDEWSAVDPSDPSFGDDGKADAVGLSTQQLLAPTGPIVVLCMENRSFDHYLGSLSLVEGRRVDGLTGSEWNPDVDGSRVAPFRFTDFTPLDPPHDWATSRVQLNGGANDGFVRSYYDHYLQNGQETHDIGRRHKDVMGYHTRNQLQASYGLADAGVVCDRWFSSVLGPTWPNRFYLHGATSNGKTGNSPIIFGFQSVFRRLEDVDISYRNYFHDVPWATGAYSMIRGVSPVENFFEAAARGTLPQYSLIDPQFFGAGANDDHPDGTPEDPTHNIQLGQALIASVYNALVKGAHRDRFLLVVVYDEHGGFYDHVAPPTTSDQRADFRQLGFRVPTVVVGPYVRQARTVSTRLEHVSIFKTLLQHPDFQRRGFKVSTSDGVAARLRAAYGLSSVMDPLLVRSGRGRDLPPLPPIEVPLQQLAGDNQGRPDAHHAELWEAAERGQIPRELDRRAEGLEVARRVLAYGEQVGAVRLR